MKLSFWESDGPIIADAQSKEPSLALMIRHYYRSYGCTESETEKYSEEYMENHPINDGH